MNDMEKKLFQFIKYPVDALNIGLSPAENNVLIMLLFTHYRINGNNYIAEFYISDRKLANLCHVSNPTVWKAKKKLSAHHIIEYRRGDGNKTWYRVMPESQLDIFDQSVKI